MSRGSHGSLFESSFNEGLAASIRRQRFEWSRDPDAVVAERQGSIIDTSGRGKRADVLIQPFGLMPVVTETEFQGSTSPVKDAITRIGCVTEKRRHKIHTAIALVAPEIAKESWKSAREVEEKLLEGTPLLYAAVTRDDILPGLEVAAGIVQYPYGEYLEGDVQDLSDFAVRVATPTSYINKLSKDVYKEIEALGAMIVEGFPVQARRNIATSLGRPEPGSAVVALCVWLNAFVLYRRISTVHDSLESIGRIRERSEGRLLLQDVSHAWNQVLKINYISVFRPARESIKHMEDAADALKGEILNRIDRMSEKIEMEPTGPLFDIGSEIFPKLATNRKETAAFYTLPETAELLASIACPSGKVGFDLSTGRIGDFACGTGTLLRSVYNKVQTQCERKGIDPETYHKRWMEEGIFGLDIQPIATHLTVSGLTGVFSRKTYDRSNIACISADSGEIGSLELLRKPTTIDLLGEKITVSDKDTGNIITVEDKSFDLIIMNPPYSRTRKKQKAFDQDTVSKEDRLASQRKLRGFLRGTFGNMKAGLGSAFSVLADQKLKFNGIFASVLPLSAASAASWNEFREKIVGEYRDIRLVGIASRKLQSFSHDTGMAEMLLVARKAEVGERYDKHIRVLNLYERPKNIAEAAEIARAFNNTDVSDSMFDSLCIGKYGQTSSEVGEWYRLPIDHKQRNAPWGIVGSLSSEMGMIARAMTKGLIRWPGEHTEFRFCQMTTIDNIFEVGPTHHRIGHKTEQNNCGAYVLLPITEKGSLPPRLSLWDAIGKKQVSMIVDPTHKAKGIKGREPLQDMMWQKRSNLFWSRGLRWTSQALQAAHTTHDCMGGRAWTSLLHDDETIKQLACLWGNSTFGFITRWWHAQRTQPGRAQIQISGIKSMPVPDFSDVLTSLKSQGAISKVKSYFEENKNSVLSVAGLAWQDDARKKIDSAIVDIFGMGGGGGYRN